MGVIRELRQDLEQEAVRLLDEYRGLLMAEALQLCKGDAVAAEDLVMCTFERYIAKKEKFDPEKGELLPWLRRVMRNLHINGNRSKAHSMGVCVSNDDLALLQELHAVDRMTEEQVEANSDAEAVRAAIASLPETSRRIIMLRYFESLPFKEVAKIMGLSEMSVKRRLYYAQKLLASRLGKAVRKPVVAILAVLLLIGASFAAFKAVEYVSEGSAAAVGDAGPLKGETESAILTNEEESEMSLKSTVAAFGAAATMGAVSPAAVMASPEPKATGGDVTVLDTDVVHSFTASGSFIPSQNLCCTVFVVGGGGGGGTMVAGGGGAGGAVIASNVIFKSGQEYPVVVGAGGFGGLRTDNGYTSGCSGESSSVAGFVAYGGGGGATWNGTQHALTGPYGSGGGAAFGRTAVAQGSKGQGCAGGALGDQSPGGGGGYSEAGGAGNSLAAKTAGKGGAGLCYDISGVPLWYAGGGGGGTGNGSSYPGVAGQGGGGEGTAKADPVPHDGVPGTGGGGGGGCWTGSLASGGGNGGSGIVILRYDPEASAEVHAALGSGVKAESSQRTITVSGSVSMLSEEGKAHVVLFVGSDPVHLEECASELLETIGAFSLSYRVADFDAEYHCVVKVKDSAEDAEWRGASAVMSLTTRDTALYAWTSGLAEGRWSDPASWNGRAKPEDCRGYPAGVCGIVQLGSAKPLTVIVDVAGVCPSRLDLTADNITIRGDDDCRALAPASFNGFPSQSLVVDALDLSCASAVFSVKSGSSLVVTNGSSVTLGGLTANAGHAEVCFAPGTRTKLGGNFILSGEGAHAVVDDATVEIGGSLVFRHGSYGATELTIRGRNARVAVRNKCGAWIADANDSKTEIVFEVPKGGFANTPLESENPDAQFGSGNNNVSFPVTVSATLSKRARPVCKTNLPLIDWTRGFKTDLVTFGSVPNPPADYLLYSDPGDELLLHLKGNGGFAVILK